MPKVSVWVLIYLAPMLLNMLLNILHPKWNFWVYILV